MIKDIMLGLKATVIITLFSVIVSIISFSIDIGESITLSIGGLIFLLASISLFFISLIIYGLVKNNKAHKINSKETKTLNLADSLGIAAPKMVVSKRISSEESVTSSKWGYSGD